MIKFNQVLRIGIGIRTGLSPVFHIGKNWGIYGDLALTSLYGYCKISDYEYYLDSAADVRSDIENNNLSLHRLTTVVEFGLGLEYMTWFYNDSYMFHVKAGWEEQAWLNVNNFFYSGYDGDLMLQGFTLNV